MKKPQGHKRQESLQDVSHQRGRRGLGVPLIVQRWGATGGGSSVLALAASEPHEMELREFMRQGSIAFAKLQLFSLSVQRLWGLTGENTNHGSSTCGCVSYGVSAGLKPQMLARH